ncbi:hypothetical protein HDU80_011385 [Chytriomyces hyalinus]|nr:hypothetical protein HDU80_011385 [Chytriomyces hyalinus]
MQPEADYHRSLVTSGKNIYVGTVGTTLSAMVVGSAWGVIAGQGAMGYSFAMGSNWLTLSLPFFAVREAVLQQRQHLNKVYNRVNFKHRDSDEMLASGIGGGVVGGGLARFVRGSWAVGGGAIIFGALAAVTQSAFTQVRHWRQEAGHRMLHDSEENAPGFAAVLRDHPIREGDLAFDDHGWDPLRELVTYMRGRFIRSVDAVPSWASPFVNALDLDYRKRLNIKIEILERQVGALKLQLKARGIVLDELEAKKE